MSTNEIAKRIGVSRSTVFRFMVTLENPGFVTMTVYGKCRLGLYMFSFGMIAYNRMELVSFVHPYLTEMAKNSTPKAPLEMFRAVFFAISCAFDGICPCIFADYLIE